MEICLQKMTLVSWSPRHRGWKNYREGSKNEDPGIDFHYHRRIFTDRRRAGEGDRTMEIKEEFYQIMTLASAYIYHNALGLIFVIEDGEVARVEKSPQAAATA